MLRNIANVYRCRSMYASRSSLIWKTAKRKMFKRKERSGKDLK